jgi:hypothetical protein
MSDLSRLKSVVATRLETSWGLNLENYEKLWDRIDKSKSPDEIARWIGDLILEGRYPDFLEAASEKTVALVHNATWASREKGRQGNESIE